MAWDPGNWEASGLVVVISESIFERSSAVQQLSAAGKDLILVRCPGDFDELLAFCRHSVCCVLIVESLVLLEATPVQVGELMRRGRSLRVLARVDPDEVVTLKHLMMLGCFGFLTDDMTVPWLRKILCAAGCGEMWVPRRLLSQMLQELRLEQNSNRLSRREREVLILLGQELSNKCIAERLFISQETLRWHLRNIYAKTRVRGRDKLIEYANEFKKVFPGAAAAEPNASAHPELSKAASANRFGPFAVKGRNE